MNATQTRPLSLSDRLRRWRYLQDVELWLDPMPGRRRREVLRELRTNISEAAGDVGMRQAIDDLGRPRSLARAYLDSEPRRRPSWSLGVIGVGVVMLVSIFVWFAYAIGMADALLDIGGRTANGSVLGLAVTTTATVDEISWETSGWSWPITIACVLAFAVCSASWRLLTRPTTTD